MVAWSRGVSGDLSAAAWLAALRGRAVVWCHGVQIHPYTSHAWVETDGAPVDEPATTSTFLRTMTIPARALTARPRRSHP
ncbi:lasso peptide biosynthesis B2 protein [Promicromonospora iranensis]|uniref:lasso peptide biosynthesis B2 protein n=1 Tax=Promicromonospora iranensis TaxID=1105144 RepID=UPI003CD0CB2E